MQTKPLRDLPDPKRAVRSAQYAEHVGTAPPEPRRVLSCEELPGVHLGILQLKFVEIRLAVPVLSSVLLLRGWLFADARVDLPR